jgi:hypothetical protein
MRSVAPVSTSPQQQPKIRTVRVVTEREHFVQLSNGDRFKMFLLTLPSDVCLWLAEEQIEKNPARFFKGQKGLTLVDYLSSSPEHHFTPCVFVSTAVVWSGGISLGLFRNCPRCYRPCWYANSNAGARFAGS